MSYVRAAIKDLTKKFESGTPNFYDVKMALVVFKNWQVMPTTEKDLRLLEAFQNYARTILAKEKPKEQELRYVEKFLDHYQRFSSQEKDPQ